MIQVTYGEEYRFLPWAASRIGINKFKDDAKSIALIKDEEILAVTVFDSFSDADCSIHIASNGSKRFLTREFLVKCFAYPFIQCRFNRITGLVPENNFAALKFDLHLGFKQEGLVREAMPDKQNIIVLGMLRRECRFIPLEYRI